MDKINDNNLKPTNKEKIIAELERLKHYGTIPYDRDIFEGVCLIESFINSLPAEQPSKVLEEAAEEYSGKSAHPLNNAFKAGAKWQEEQIMKSAIDALVDDVTQKVKSLDRVFEIVDVVNDKVAMIGETAVSLLSGVVKKVFKTRKKYKKESEEEEDE